MQGFPLTPMFRRMAEGRQEQADELLAAAVRDMRELLAGRPRSSTFKPTTDPVDLVVQGARLAELCRITLKLDDEAHGKPWTD